MNSTTAGTSLEILAPYLPYDLLITTPGGIMRMFGLDKWSVSAVYPSGNNTGHDMPLVDVMPILRPFSALCDPLPDGTVPAVHAAITTLPHVEFLGDGHGITVRETPQVTGRCVYVFLTLTNTRYGANDGDWTAVIGDDFEVKMEHRNGPTQSGSALRVFDYLRSQHFAVGLTPEQFIPKT